MFKIEIQAKTLDDLKSKLSAMNAAFNEGQEAVTTLVESKPTVAETVVEETANNIATVLPMTEVAPTNMGGAPGTAIELDAEGIPWDARIHAGSKSKIKKGTWTLKRGVDPALVAQVKAELLGTTTAATVAEVAPIAEQPAVEAAPAALPTMQSGHTVETFSAQFPMIISSLINEGKITQDYLNQLKDYFKVEELYMISAEQKAQMFEGFVQHGFVTKIG